MTQPRMITSFVDLFSSILREEKGIEPQEMSIDRNDERDRWEYWFPADHFSADGMVKCKIRRWKDGVEKVECVTWRHSDPLSDAQKANLAANIRKVIGDLDA